jgi:hypothetical protein
VQAGRFERPPRYRRSTSKSRPRRREGAQKPMIRGK